MVVAKSIIAASAMAISMTVVPERMLLTSSMKATDIASAKLIALDIGKIPGKIGEDDTPETEVVVIEGETQSLRRVVKSHTGKHGSICFVVRRPEQ
jgi:hypothetical protein